MEQSSKNFLYLRSDGFHETADGQFAVRMRYMTVLQANGIARFTYKPTFDSDEITVEWNSTDLVQLFPEAMARALLNLGYARYPKTHEVQWLEDLVNPPASTEPPASVVVPGSGDSPGTPENPPSLALSAPPASDPAPAAPEAPSGAEIGGSSEAEAPAPAPAKPAAPKAPKKPDASAG